VRAGGSGKRIGGNTDTAPGVDPTPAARPASRAHHNAHRPHRGSQTPDPCSRYRDPATNGQLTPCATSSGTVHAAALLVRAAESEPDLLQEFLGDYCMTHPV
jgi:hypothetical protein